MPQAVVPKSSRRGATRRQDEMMPTEDVSALRESHTNEVQQLHDQLETMTALRSEEAAQALRELNNIDSRGRVERDKLAQHYTALLTDLESSLQEAAAAQIVAERRERTALEQLERAKMKSEIGSSGEQKQIAQLQQLLDEALHESAELRSQHTRDSIAMTRIQASSPRSPPRSPPPAPVTGPANGSARDSEREAFTLRALLNSAQLQVAALEAEVLVQQQRAKSAEQREWQLRMNGVFRSGAAGVGTSPASSRPDAESAPTRAEQTIRTPLQSRAQRGRGSDI